MSGRELSSVRNTAPYLRMNVLPVNRGILLPFLGGVALPRAPVEVVRRYQLHAAAVRLIKADVLELMQLLQVHDMRDEPDDVERLRRRCVKLRT